MLTEDLFLYFKEIISKYVIRCYLFECSKSNELKVVLKLGNLRSQPDQYEILLLREGVKNKIIGNFQSVGRGGGFMIFYSLTLSLVLSTLPLVYKTPCNTENSYEYTEFTKNESQCKFSVFV